MTLSSVSEGGNRILLKYSDIQSEIMSCNSIKFAAYRTASKLLVLQKHLGFSNVSLQVIKGVLEQHRLLVTDNYLILSMEEVENILHDIFYAARHDDKQSIELFVELTKNPDFGRVSVLDLKIVLVCLCSSSLYSKYLYWFSQFLDHNLCLPRRRFHTMLQTLLLITHYLSESVAFSNDLIQPTLDSCFTQEHHLEIGISENEFINWLTKEPQLLVWLSTFYRLSISQKVSHNVECSVCGVFPIHGLRYHCLRCIRYDLCQLCFFTAKSSKHHKPKHIIKEYCSQTSFVETASTYVKEIFKRICGQSTKLQYLPASNSFVCRRVNNSTGQQSAVTDKDEKIKNTLAFPNDVDNRLRGELREIILDFEKEASNLLNEECDTKHLINLQVRFLEECLGRVKALQVDTDTKKVASTETDVSSSTTVSSHCSSSVDKDTTAQWVPSISGFSTWLEDAQHETTYTKQLQSDLDNIMAKLNNMLESNFSINEGD